MPLTIWWSAPNTPHPSMYGGLHQTLYAPDHMVICTKPHHTVVCTKHSHLCPSPYGGLLNVAQNSMTVHGASMRADLCSYLTPPHVSSLGFLCNTQNETSCRSRCAGWQMSISCVMHRIKMSNWRSRNLQLICNVHNKMFWCFLCAGQQSPTCL